MVASMMREDVEREVVVLIYIMLRDSDGIYYKSKRIRF